MTSLGWLEILLCLALPLACAKPLGWYLARVFSGGAVWLGLIEGLVYRAAGIGRDDEQSWFRYARAFLVFHLVGMLVFYGLLRLQGVLPLNPAGQAALSPDLALNTAVSFATNTSWESYAGEATLGHLAQMAGVGVQSFLSAAAGIAVAIALVRGFARHGSATIGSFWVDLTRAVLYVLLPVCVGAAVLFAWSGAPQIFAGPVAATTLDSASQTIAVGPVASQEAIKLLSGDGGGFFNAQSAHPFETPTPAANVLAILLIAALGVGLTNAFGRMVGNPRQGWALLGAMLLLLAVGTVLIYAAEAAPPHIFAGLGIDASAGNLEGKDLRFGIPGAAVFSEIGTATSSGAVNSALDSYAPLGVLGLLANMMVSEVIIGGPGSGLFSILLFAMLSVFIGGMMIGRTPDYLGKKIEAHEVKLAMLAILAPAACLLGLTALACVLPVGLAALGNEGPRGFSEMLYAYTSAANTNGSALAGLSADTPFWNITLAVAMAIGRYVVIVPVLAIAGSLASKRRAPPSAGSLPTTGLIWIGLLVGVIVIVGGLTYLPALVLGPVAEHLG